MALNSSLLRPVLAAIANNTEPASTPAASNDSNATQTNATKATPFAIPTDMSSLLSRIYSITPLRDWIRYGLIGFALASCRQIYHRAYSSIVSRFFVSATFDGRDMVYNWMLHWFSRHAVMRNVRDLDISTSNSGFSVDELEGRRNHTPDDTVSRRSTTQKARCMPSYSETYSFWHKGRWMTVYAVRYEDSLGWGWGIYFSLNLIHRILTRNRAALAELITEAQELYETSRMDSIDIFEAGSEWFDRWRLACTRPKRPLASVIFDVGFKEVILEDAKDFMQSKKWYTDRGIPFRRGYLLHGPPGTGKTSIVHSIAGELMLDIYIISLGKNGTDDRTLNACIASLPEQCIALIEDIDAAFTSRGLDDNEAGAQNGDPDDSGTYGTTDRNKTGSRVTLSGLLNALDGIGAQEGRLLFATTNRYEVLDPALIRPGRMDLHVEFGFASCFQAREMFLRYYFPGETGNASKHETASEHKVDDLDSAIPSERDPATTLDPVDGLADDFASRIPERELSMASLQGYLMQYKVRPVQAVENVKAWLEKKRKKAADSKAQEVKSADEVATTSEPVNDGLVFEV
ncbi:P-loop containing nucleoside triphosphate hydrolase protein [Stereum hirsutum FP-91666 SS1]|uniref:P-loop containing nucleoside triphosphate hydrolase protein n=1 Tax=Stereum hirsutum (strain FP-91666) TaxID=721885 RepID=UPI000444934B|nr:P-loop containing nucleoside triphosphate hydrolase protein [Stereum hirsutum FP-91666 SS1]EIM82485.1 P-loop containing nucleoside triphosphate hydrolase protein [Stereum hirsutum FP-91666 SS1]